LLLRGCELVAISSTMAKPPLHDTAEVEIICPRCGYHTARTVARLRRRDTKVVCASCGDDLVAPSTGDLGRSPDNADEP
jgi:predicted RNA-binding Zn-ribbon protein involved in translation (DUF1610 family)